MEDMLNGYNNQISEDNSDSTKLKDSPRKKPVNPLIPVERDLTWLKKYCLLSIKQLLDMNDQVPRGEIQKSIHNHLEIFPDANTDLPYDKFLTANKFCFQERLIIAMAIAPYFSPTVLSSLSSINPLTNTSFPQAGGIINKSNNEFFPTLETIRFLTTKNTIKETHYIDPLLKSNSRLISENIIKVVRQEGEMGWNKTLIQPSEEFLALIKGEHYHPSYSSKFPASIINTDLEWKDLVLPYDTHEELRELKAWLKHSQNILSHPHLRRFIKPGFRGLFYGPPGTGKTLTASLLGKSTGLEVYRVDLSMVVSKWVGETEKNLKNIFDQAENKNWILFFDEADSLFGKRTQNKSSNDRHANQEIAYLLQRIEEFPGVIILATNLKENMDEAFSRRFQSMVYFPIPDTETRYSLWKKLLPPDFKLEESINLYEIADNYKISGGIIVNVVRYCTLMAWNDNRNTISQEDMEYGIAKELKKAGKVIG
jgi:hypothetical protein